MRRLLIAAAIQNMRSEVRIDIPLPVAAV